MSERQIFHDNSKFAEAYGDDPLFMELADKVEAELAKLMEEHGVDHWTELPQEVLESFSIEVRPEVKGNLR